jgi:hypothetical protein
MGVQVSGVSLSAAQLVELSETAVQTSDVSWMLVHVSDVSDSGVHFRIAETDTLDEQTTEEAAFSLLTTLMEVCDCDAIDT